MARTIMAAREQVARALYLNTPTPPATPWEKLSATQKIGWYSDAQKALCIASEYFSSIADARDPEKPTNYLHRRENIGTVMRGVSFYPDGKCHMADLNQRGLEEITRPLDAERQTTLDARDKMTGNNDCWLNQPGCKGACGSYGCGG